MTSFNDLGWCLAAFAATYTIGGAVLLRILKGTWPREL